MLVVQIRLGVLLLEEAELVLAHIGFDLNLHLLDISDGGHSLLDDLHLIELTDNFIYFLLRAFNLMEFVFGQN